MFSKIKKSLGISKQKMEADLYVDPPPDYYGGDFFATPSAPPGEEFDEFTEETLHVEAELIVKTKHPIESLKEMMDILGTWIDKCSGPVRQRHLDTWIYLCLGLHLRRDQTIKTYNVYRAALDLAVKFKHSPKGSGRFDYATCFQQFDIKHKGSDCDISFNSVLTPTKRKGCPAHVLYNQPLKNGEKPPNPEEVFPGYDVKVTVAANGVHEIQGL